MAGALDRIGERWSLLIVRELLLGPLRFSDLARAVGGAPTDVLTRRLRDLEDDGVVSRRELGPPASAFVYELTELGHGLERVVIELGRWGLHFQRVEDVEHLEPTSLPNALRVVLRPPATAALTLGLRSGGHAYRLRIEDGWITAERGEAADADLTLSGTPRDVLAALIVGEPRTGAIEIEGDRAAFEVLRSMVDLPDSVRAAALAATEDGPAVATAVA